MTTKTAYQFDISGMFLGETEADESPLEPGKYLLPARCTFVKPPIERPTGQWPRWNGGAWALATRPRPVAEDPVAKLQAFLQENPDVAALLQPGIAGEYHNF